MSFWIAICVKAERKYSDECVMFEKSDLELQEYYKATNIGNVKTGRKQNDVGKL